MSYKVKQGSIETEKSRRTKKNKIKSKNKTAYRIAWESIKKKFGKANVQTILHF